MYDVLDVAKYVLYYARKHDYGMSVLQLMKILYFVQAQFLVSKKKRAFPDDILLWTGDQWKEKSGQNMASMETPISQYF